MEHLDNNSTVGIYKTLKQRLVDEFNIPENEFGNYNSDLYIKYTKERYTWIEKNYEFGSDSFLSTFKNNIDGEKWIEVVFGYKEWFDNKNSKLIEDVIEKNN